MAKTVLVTGAYGFLGRHAASHFSKAGHMVSGVGHGAWERAELKKYGFTYWHTADITLDALCTYANAPDIIVHCAGSGSVVFSMSHPYQDYVRTVSTTAAVLEYVRLHSPHTVVVYPSSAAVYGAAERLPIKESDLLRPTSPYGVHKQMAENLCMSYAKNFGILIAIVRFFSLYGEGLQKQLLWDACSKVASGSVNFFGTGEELRDWLHVDDAARLLQISAEHAATSCPIVNGASGESVSVRDVLSEIFLAYGIPATFDFSGNARSGDPLKYQADMTAVSKWGWQPTIGLREGVVRYVDWFKKSKK